MRTAIGTLLVAVALIGGAPAAAQEDPFRDFRRADGTLQWEALLASGSRTPVRLKNFSLESFVRELARVVSSGDRERVGEFFDGVVATDFYKNYGLFVVGVTATEVGYDMAYRRYLHRYLKPQFVSGILRANVSLAAGLALAELVAGDFNGKVFAISMTSLGLSSALVTAGLARIPAVHKLQTTARLAGATRWLRAGSFVYQTAELALVFFVGRLVENYYYAWSERKATRDRMGAAAERVLRELEGATTPDAIGDALALYASAWVDYRNSLYGPLFRDRLEFLERLTKLAERAKITENEIDRATSLQKRYPGLPLAEFSARRRSVSDERADREMQTILEAYMENWKEHWAEVYVENRTFRDPFTRVVLRIEANDRHLSRRVFVQAHDGVSRNRLESYVQERTAMHALSLLFPGHDATIQDAVDRLRALEQADRRLATNDSGVLPFTLSANTAHEAAGLVGNLEHE